MINQLAREVFAQTETYAGLQKMVSQAEAVHNTEKVLDEFGLDLRRWAAVFPTIAPLIDPEKADMLRKDAAAIGRQIAASRDEFANQNFQQAAKLMQLKSRIDKLQTSTRAVWTEYAEAQVAPYRELARVAERLPKMAGHLEAIRDYLLVAEKQAADLPTKATAVEQFQNCLARLDTLLSDLEGLPGEVRLFLDKLMRGKATFADVTGTVFAWCHDEGLTEKLQITFLQ